MLHGGTVTVHSAGVGLGTSFVVTLPAQRAELTEADQSADAEPGGRPRLTGVRVLAVDDDEDARELVLLTVRSSGAEVMVVGSGEAALDAVGSFQPHVLVADIAMPGMDGYTLVSNYTPAMAMRRLPRSRCRRYLTSVDVERSRRVGFAHHLGKPVDYERLVNAIAELAGGRA